MPLTRRHIMQIGLGTLATSGLAPLAGQAATLPDALDALTGGAEIAEGGIDLTTPEIAENGNTVPIEVSAPGAALIAIFAEENPEAEVVTFNFGPLAASHSASTRIRLARTQNVIAVAQMADGSFTRTAKTVKVTIGGCGG